MDLQMRKILLGLFLLFSAYSNAQIVNDWYDSTSFHGGVSVGSNLRIPSGAVNGYVLTTNGAGLATWQASQGGGGSTIDTSNFWNINGNSGTDSTNFIGTTDSNDFVIKTDAVERLRLNAGGGGSMELNGNNFSITDTVNSLTISIDDSLGAKVARMTSVSGNSQYTVAVGSFGLSLSHTHLNNGQLNGFLSIVDYENSLVRKSGDGRVLFISNTDELNTMSISDSVTLTNVSEITNTDSTIVLLTNYSSKVKLVDDAMLGVYSDVQKWRIDSNGLAHFNSVKITDGTQANGYVLKSDANGLASWQAGDVWVLLATTTASASATVDFTGLTSAYSAYKVIYSDVVAATNGDAFWIRLGTGSTSWASGASDYAHGRYGIDVLGTTTTSTAFATGDGTDSKIVAIGSQLNTLNYTTNGEIEIYNPSQSSKNHYITGKICAIYNNAGNANLVTGNFGAYYASTTAVTGIRMLMSTGNITSGVFKIYGLK